jgi:hypothetical protein
MASSWIVTRTTRDGGRRYRVEFRQGGREAPTRYGGSFRAPHRRDQRRRRRRARRRTGGRRPLTGDDRQDGHRALDGARPRWCSAETPPATVCTCGYRARSAPRSNPRPTAHVEAVCRLLAPAYRLPPLVLDATAQFALQPERSGRLLCQHPADRKRGGRARRRRVQHVQHAVGFLEQEVLDQLPVGAHALGPDAGGAEAQVA